MPNFDIEIKTPKNNSIYNTKDNIKFSFEIINPSRRLDLKAIARIELKESYDGSNVLPSDFYQIMFEPPLKNNKCSGMFIRRMKTGTYAVVVEIFPYPLEDEKEKITKEIKIEIIDKKLSLN